MTQYLKKCSKKKKKKGKTIKKDHLCWGQETETTEKKWRVGSRTRLGEGLSPTVR